MNRLIPASLGAVAITVFLSLPASAYIQKDLDPTIRWREDFDDTV